VPELIREHDRSVLANYIEGTELTVESYPMADANVDHDALADAMDDDVVMVYAENPTVRGTIEEQLASVGERADDHDALFCLGTDPVALAMLERPVDVGADVVVGDAATLGLGTAYGMGLGLFVTREEYLRQMPGRLVGAGEDASGRRAYTLTLQTREQHIRRERATSNICTNQAWVALRTAIHVASLGPEGLVDLAEEAVVRARDLAERLDDISGVRAPVHDRHHFREFVARVDQPAPAVAADLADAGYAVHTLGDHHLQFCVTETNERHVDDLVAAVAEVAQ
jgi:glycine dehydrogenase subunit 1